jgi:hypothetical protein
MRPVLALVAGLAALAVPTAAAAAKPAPPPAPDTVTGSAFIGVGFSSSTYTVDAFSGPSGEAPGGTITVRGLLADFDLTVTCLRVRGTRAVVTGRQEGAGRVISFVLVLEDVPVPGTDRASTGSYLDTPPPACADVDIDQQLLDVRSGSFTIVDAPAPPATKKACREGGWQALGFPSKRACKKAVVRPPGR